MADRSYRQFCALARALDHVGDRWTLLVVRELLPGPKRYSDIRDGLPGIATNLLAERLRRLERDGVVERSVLPPPAASTVYELTGHGRELEPVLLGLIRWGERWMHEPRAGDAFRPGWLALALRALLPARTHAGDVSADVRVGGALAIEVHDGSVSVDAAAAPAPDVVVEGDARSLLAVAAGRETLPAAVRAGRLRTHGPRPRVRDLSSVLGSAR